MSATDVDASPLRPVTSVYQLTAGSSHLADTYLSPLKYSGWSMGLGYQRWQVAPFGEHRYLYHLDLNGEIDRAVNSAGNATMLYGEIQASWGVSRRWEVLPGLRVGVGPALSFDIGCIYNARNSNNPASAKCALTLDAACHADWNFTFLNRRFTLLYQAHLPVIGAFFSPQYDELYYEIYLGNHSGLCHPAWWGNRWKFTQQLSLDIPLGATRLRVGYAGTWMSSSVNHLTTRSIRHCFVLGFTNEWISLKSHSNSRLDKARVISALY